MNFIPLLYVFSWLTVFSLVWVDDAQAYIDPGTGGVFIQSLVAGIVGASFLIKTYWHKIKNVFTRKKDV